MKLAELITTHDVDVLAHLDREVDVPVLTAAQAQGDLIVLPSRRKYDGQAVPAEGVPVVRGENGGNTHTLLAGGAGVLWMASRSLPDLGVLHVPAGEVAYLAHPEHGYAGIGPGTYTIRRQRQQADEIRIVAD